MRQKVFEMVPWPAVIATAIPLAGGSLSGWVSREGTKDWYESLKTPDWTPPNYAFPIMWTALYGSMGYASYIVWKKGGGFAGPAKLALVAYGAQLALNFAWSPIFFRQHSIKGGLITIGLLDTAVVATTYLFHSVAPNASFLMAPYIAWLSLATALNYCIWRDNPTTPEVKDKDKDD